MADDTDFTEMIELMPFEPNNPYVGSAYWHAHPNCERNTCTLQQQISLIVNAHQHSNWKLVNSKVQLVLSLIRAVYEQSKA